MYVCAHDGRCDIFPIINFGERKKENGHVIKKGSEGKVLVTVWENDGGSRGRIDEGERGRCGLR